MYVCHFGLDERFVTIATDAATEPGIPLLGGGQWDLLPVVLPISNSLAVEAPGQMSGKLLCLCQGVFKLLDAILVLRRGVHLGDALGRRDARAFAVERPGGHLVSPRTGAVAGL